ncbi:MAG: transporter substrate-binding domain-containing protein, partial [Spirochaetales bacterium]|nr:transporter substrate-binding domain-containing protein [Spirochaetales bacterium]
MLKKYICVLIFFITCSLLFAQDIIYAASEPNYPPFCIVDENGEADGFSVDLFKESAAAMYLEVEFKVDSWVTIKKELAEGKIDALPL